MKLRFGLLILWWLLAGSALGVERLRLQLPWKHQFEFAGFYAAQQQGYYEDAGLEVEILPWSGTYSVTLLEQGKVDVAVMGSPVLQEIVRGAPLQLIGVTFQHSPLVLLSHEPVIDPGGQLRGKRIMGSPTFELLALLQQAGLTVDDVELVPQIQTLTPFLNRDVDLTTAFSTNQPHRLRDMGVPFWIVDPKSFGLDSYQGLWVVHENRVDASPMALEHFRQASIRGWHYALRHPEALVEYILQLPGMEKSRRQLLQEARSMLPLVDSGEQPLGELSHQRLIQHFRQLAHLGFITPEQQASLDMDSILFRLPTPTLTDEERAWIAAHPVVRLANDAHWPPFEYIDEQGRYRGMVAELLQLIGQRTGLRFEPATDLSWQQVVATMKAGRLDMFSAAVATPERRKYARFTPPFFRFPMVMLAREGHGYIPDITRLEGERIGVVADYSTDEKLSGMQLRSELLRFTHLGQALQALTEGRIDVLVDNLVSLNYEIRSHGQDGLVVVGQLDEPFDLAMGIRKDLPVLHSIVTKALEQISERERQALYDRWLQLKVMETTDHGLLLNTVLAAGILVLVLVLFLAWQRRLSQKLQAHLREVQELTLSAETDAAGHIRMCTRSLARVLNQPVEDLLGTPHPLFQHSAQPEALMHAMQQGKEWKETVHFTNDAGRELWLDCHALPQMRHGRLQCARITAKDVTSEKLLERASLHDSLTGLSNRRHFNQIFEQEVLRARRDGRHFYWAMLDLDHFKNLNDTLGHQKGDQALVKVAHLFRQHFNRAGDAIFRLGGEEFGLQMQLAHERELQPKLEALRQAVENLAIPNPMETGGVLTVSIGAVIVPPDVQARPEWIYQQADEMLYQAKAAGRNRVMITRIKPEPERKRANG